MVRLSQEEELRPNILKYVNRLSDLFFVLSRYVAKLSGVPETLWDTGLGTRKPGKL
jgi:cob(I)alamin adenosyltransferase